MYKSNVSCFNTVIHSKQSNLLGEFKHVDESLTDCLKTYDKCDFPICCLKDIQRVFFVFLHKM